MPDSKHMGFYQKQIRVALRNCGTIDPENIDEAIARDAYQALGKVITELGQEETINIIKSSGLRGRGGAGFPTGLKWDIARKTFPIRSMWYVMLTKVILELLWIVLFLRVIRILS